MKYPKITHGELGKQKWMNSKEAIDDLWDKIDATEIKTIRKEITRRQSFILVKGCRVTARLMQIGHLLQ